MVVRDRQDVGVIECADAGGNCEYIITGGRNLLSLKRYKQIKIVTAGELVRTLKSESVSSDRRERRPLFDPVGQKNRFSWQLLLCKRARVKPSDSRRSRVQSRPGAPHGEERAFRSLVCGRCPDMSGFDW